MKRRDFLIHTSIVSSALLLSKNLIAQTNAKKHLIGHTGITWGYSPQNAPQAIADVGKLGYHSFESFGSILEYWDTRGGLQEQLPAANLPLIGAYCPMILTDASKRKEEVEKIQRWGKLIKQYGGSIAVIGPDNVERDKFDFNSTQKVIVDSLNEMGQALLDVGITGALHQHTGSCITTREETYAVMESINTDLVKLCPDTGELLAAGIDPVQAVKDFLPIIAHVHIKDFKGHQYHDGYTSVGDGKVDVKGVLDVLETSDLDFMIMAELNPDTEKNKNDPQTAFELAKASKQTFVDLGYTFRSLS